MAATNKKATDNRKNTAVRTAGGHGVYAATQTAEQELRRLVMANMLWENVAYADGQEVAQAIQDVIKRLPGKVVADIAIEARTKQKLRHVPLLLARELARNTETRILVGDLLPRIILRADEITEFMSLYWQGGVTPIAKQVKRGLADAFNSFDAYQFAKYNRDTAVKLRDVMFLVHPRPPQGKEELYRQIADDTLPVPDTWEVALSNGANKRETWERLIKEGKLGALAFVRNLRNMIAAEVSDNVILEAFNKINPMWLTPLNFLTAAKNAPRFTRQIEDMMLRGLAAGAKLPGKTVIVIDTSGSMGKSVSYNSSMTRRDAAAAMAILAAEVCEFPVFYATAGNDTKHVHATAPIQPVRGFGMDNAIDVAAAGIGGGGIFTRQCLEYIAAREKDVDRVIVFSDSQDCDHVNTAPPKPFGKTNYIIDVSAHQHGVNYKGVWTAEISGWSEHFLNFIMALEGLTLSEQTE